MELHPAVAERLDRLAADQRAAATAPPGPVLCVAPAGSGKTTTIVARVAWLVASGTAAESIAAITFNRRAAVELEGRLNEALEPLGVPAGGVRVRTFHALALEVLADGPRGPAAIADRDRVLRELIPTAGAAELAALDTAISRLKVEHGVDPAEVAADIARDGDAGPIARAFVAYQAALAARGELDFDDLVLGALDRLGADQASLEGWRRRCDQLLVDEVQDVDRAQLQLALLLAAPDNRIFMVGDDDQSIYGWRLADVRRILDLERRLPGLRRFELTANYRCPRPVVERSIRLIARNRERFPKVIRAGPQAAGRLVLAPDGRDDDERIGLALDRWPADGSRRAILARTNAELVPAAAVAIERGIAYRAGSLRLPVDAPEIESALVSLLASAAAEPELPLLVLIGRLRSAADPAVEPGFAALLGWAPRFTAAAALVQAVRDQRDRGERLRNDGADLSLLTAHAVKGLEFDHVLVVMDADRFPSRRAIDEAADPARALEEERRLAYVAWTRARRSLTLLYDPALPSRFLLEAFDRRELR